jgi:hypothetical protein
VRETTGDRSMTGRQLRNRIIAAVEGRIGGRCSNEIKVFGINILDNTAVTQEAETLGTVVMSQC